MDDRARVAAAACLGATVGAVLGYLYLTESGYRLRLQIEPRLDDFVGEIRRLRGTVEKARSAASEGWQSLNEFTAGSRWEGNQRVSH